MFPRLAILAYIFNYSLFLLLLIPFSLFTSICLLSALILIKKDNENPNPDINLGNPLNIWNAVGFGVVYLTILFAVFYGNLFFGERGLYYLAVIAGLADTDAITISMSKFVKLGGNVSLATHVMIIAVISNKMVKLGISLFKGAKVTGKYVMYAFGSVILAGGLYILYGTWFY
jgi:uncharacterized membrane protein (DUF4010 family)